MSRNRISVKQRLIMRIEKKLYDEGKLPSHERYAYESMLRELHGRGSGPLPFYFRELAREWGIE